MAEKSNTVRYGNNLMVVCAGCGFVLKEGDLPISHGMCEQCYKEALREIEQYVVVESEVI